MDLDEEYSKSSVLKQNIDANKEFKNKDSEGLILH